ncbi:MAG: FHA domain-containing protein [Vicinamibacterales bacterium]
MADSIDQIDVTCVAELGVIKQDRDRLEGFRARADLLKDRVDGVVYRRVLDDYDRKRAELDARAAPLTATARAQYQALLALERQVQSAYNDARLAKEELEFRHAVGELDEGELQTRIAEPDGVIERLQIDLDAVIGLKAKFVAVVPSEDVLLPPAPPPRVAPAAAAPAPAPPSDHSAVTIIQRPAPAAPPAPAATPMPEATGAQTFHVPDATLEPVDDSTDGEHFRLGIETSIGRSAENHIRLVKTGVSRRHAVIRLGESGFVLEDLASQNGTFVNGTRVATHALVDGDVIWIGDAKVMFKSAWTPPGAAKEPAGGSAVNSSRRLRRP